MPAAGLFILWLGASYHTFVLFFSRIGNDYFAPYLKLGTLLKDEAGDVSLNTLDKGALVRLVKGLQAENHVLTSQSMLMTELQRQNDELRKMVNLPLKFSHQH